MFGCLFLRKGVSSMPKQTDWRFCCKCGALYFDGFLQKGACAAGGGHEAAGFIFILPHDVPDSANAQRDWRFCEKCQVMYFDGFPQKGACAAGGGHEAAGFNFVFPHDVAETPTAQRDWRFCRKCEAMYFDGFTGKGVCPAGGGHEAARFNFVLPHVDDDTGPLTSGLPRLIRGRTRKVVQLVGEEDREPGRHSPKTFSKCCLYGTDLGTPLDFGPGGDLWLLFGDAWTATKQGNQLVPVIHTDEDDRLALKPPYNRFRPFNADPVGVAPPTVTAETLSQTFELDFRRAPVDPDDQDCPGGYATLEVPGVSLLTEAVPTGAIRTPSGEVYVWVTGKAFHLGGSPRGDGPQGSWVARWSDLKGMRTEPPYLLSQNLFSNFCVPVVGGVNDGTHAPGHPTDGEVVWLWGTKFPNRQSSVRLAYVPLRQIGDRAAWRFYCGITSGGSPRWLPDEVQAKHLFENSSVGEFSVAWNRHLQLWLMLYSCPDPRGILCRWAANPWGPWAVGVVVFDPNVDPGYGDFMHSPGSDSLSDPGLEKDFGGEYAPIIIPRYTLGSRGTTTIRYTMSTWNPYTVVLMESELRLSS
jgi:hypothetical protein